MILIFFFFVLFLFRCKAIQNIISCIQFQEKQINKNGWVKKVFKFKHDLQANGIKVEVSRKNNVNKPLKVKGIKIKACFNPNGKTLNITITKTSSCVIQRFSSAVKIENFIEKKKKKKKKQLKFHLLDLGYFSIYEQLKCYAQPS